MEYRVLGSLDVRDGEGSVALGGAKQRAVLALLLLNANQAVSRDRLIDELWGEEPPETAVQSIHVYVSRLRKLLPPGTLITEPAGYVLQVDPDDLDLTRFERLVADARASLEAGDPERGSRFLHEALALWRGPALAEFAFEAFARTEVRRLEELRVAAVGDRIEADLALGRHADVIGELEALIAANPHGERPREQLMVALYRSGRQAEALEAYRAARERLDELGLEPGERLRQLEKAILTHDALLEAPAEKTNRRGQTNLPIPATSWVGRKQQLADVTALLSDRAIRIVTLTGAAGSGKTRLALQAADDLADDFPHGMFFVGLETVRDPAVVVPTLAKTLGVQAPPGDELEQAVRDRLAARRLLVVLDNFEQVLAAAPSVARLLTADAAFLVTSRAPLHIAAEREYPVPPLALAEARDLFVERARAVVPLFEPTPAVADVCRRLDCLPLAIELAAARTKLLSPAAILPRLDRRLSLLTRGPSDLPVRQQTLRAALDWSYDLLTEPERQLFARLAVFAGGFDPIAAEQVADADLDTLQALIDHGLVRVNGDRFSLLESIREHAAERLSERPDADTTRLEHGRYFASFGERWITDARQGTGREALRALIVEVANLDAARTQLRTTAHRSDELRVLEALATAQSLVGMNEETLRLLEEGLASDDLPDDLRRRFEAQAGWIAAECGRHARARELAIATRERARRIGDAESEVDALGTIAYVACEEGDLSTADAALHEAELLSRRKLPKKLAPVLNDRSVVALERGEYALARTMLDEAEAVSGDISFGIWGNRALSYLLEGRSREARPWLVRGLRSAHEVGAVIPIFVALLGLAALEARDDPERGALLCGAAESLRGDLAIRMQRLELGMITETREALTAQLGERFYELSRSGGELELDDAVALALAS